MAPRRWFADRVKETSTTTGTGDATLAGAATGYQTFNTAFGNGSSTTAKRFWYVIEGGAEWEVGRGYLSGSTTLVREFVSASSNSNALVSFSAGTKNVFQTLPADLAQDVARKGKAMALASGNFLG